VEQNVHNKKNFLAVLDYQNFLFKFVTRAKVIKDFFRLEI
jgi:hypothetical protein